MTIDLLDGFVGLPEIQASVSDVTPIVGKNSNLMFSSRHGLLKAEFQLLTKEIVLSNSGHQMHVCNSELKEIH